jgi:hypothetical protein
VAADARDRLRGRPEGIRIDVVAGDMFASVPHGGDAYVLLTVLRCFNDEECRQILARLRESMSDASRLLALEMVYPDDPLDGRSGLADLQAMVVYGGADRSATEWQELLVSAGFETPIITPVDQSYSWVEAARAQHG